VRRHPSQGSERLAIWLLVTITSSLRGERVTAASTFGASPGGLTAQVSYWLLTTSTGTAIAPGSASKSVSGAAGAGHGRGEDDTGYFRAVEPWLVPISRGGMTVSALGIGFSSGADKLPQFLRSRRAAALLRNRRFADSPLEEAVRSEPVSEGRIPCFSGKIQGISSFTAQRAKI
jgi:hypothetical protein